MVVQCTAPASGSSGQQRQVEFAQENCSEEWGNKGELWLGGACGPACESSKAAEGASVSLTKARWQKSSTAWDAGRCHPRVRSREGSSSGWDGASACSNSSQMGGSKPMAAKELRATRKDSRASGSGRSEAREPTMLRAKGASRRLTARSASAQEAQYAAGACLVALRNPSPPCRIEQAAHVFGLVAASRRQRRQRGAPKGSAALQYHGQQHTPVCCAAARCEWHTAPVGPRSKKAAARRPGSLAGQAPCASEPQ